MKKIIKKITPHFMINFYHKYKKKLELKRAFIADYKHYSRYSSTHEVINDKQKLLFRIIKDYHALEKGLTLPNPRLGFGKIRILDIYNNCSIFLSEYSEVNEQIHQALSTILEYENYHNLQSYTLDFDTQKIIDKVKEWTIKYNLKPSKQLTTTKNELFKNIKGDFAIFSNSRKSIREYANDKQIPTSLWKDIINLSLNAPSACNRQASRVYIFNKKADIEKVLAYQNGNAGFGDLASAVIVITTDVSAFYDPMERNQAYIDGGIYAMNLLYSLHYHGIASCMLNCSNTPEKDSELRSTCNIRASEIFIAMISCGYASDNISIAISKRFRVNDICVVN